MQLRPAARSILLCSCHVLMPFMHYIHVCTHTPKWNLSVNADKTTEVYNYVIVLFLKAILLIKVP